MPAKLAALQALILCGPGSSFPTFTANPDEHPKALLSIANRPMIWYSLQYCYRMGVRSKIHHPFSPLYGDSRGLNTIY
jgi:translation initiation factor eIF-2B subunit gamma